MRSPKTIFNWPSITGQSRLLRKPPAQERREFLDLILSNPILDGLPVRFELKKPFAALVEMKEKKEWCPQPDSNWHSLSGKDFLTTSTFAADTGKTGFVRGLDYIFTVTRSSFRCAGI